MSDEYIETMESFLAEGDEVFCKNGYWGVVLNTRGDQFEIYGGGIYSYNEILKVIKKEAV